MKDVAIVAYCRTGIGKAQRGALNMTHGIPMTAHVLRHAVERAAIEGSEVEDVVVGCGLGRRNKHRAVAAVCTAGGMATAALLERA